MSSHLLLASIVSDENSAVNHFESSLVPDKLFSSCCFQSFLFVFQHFYSSVSECGSLCLYYLEFVEFVG